MFSSKTMVHGNQQQFQAIKAQVSAFIRTELGLEAVPQMIVSTLILLVSGSQTRTVFGLEIFNDFAKERSFDEFGISISPIVFIVAANAWTLISTWRSYIKGLCATKCLFSMKAQAILGLFVLVASFIKVSSNVLFMMPALGLCNCLRHLQGERFPYWVAMTYNVDVAEDLVYFSNISFPWSDLTRFDYTNKSHPTPPDVTLYTQFDLMTYLLSFWVIFGLQTFLVILAKKISNPKVFEKLSWNAIITNSLENVWIQSPMQDWDDEYSSMEEYKDKQKRNGLEMGFVIFINMTISIVMLVPIWILRKYCFFARLW